jgi:hypothetical protein
MLIKVPHAEMHSKLGFNYDCFVCCASFETRSISIALSLASYPFARAFVLQISPPAELARPQKVLLQKTFGEKLVAVEVRVAEPLYTVDQYHAHLVPAIRESQGLTLIDVTTFTHEHLLMLMYVLRSEKVMHKVHFAYTGAQDYSANTPLSDIWLTKGVKQVRSVAGFPGALVPSRDLHLIVMVGFEHERAQTVIEAYEPARLTLGLAPRLQSISDELSQTNKAFYERVQKFVRSTREGTTSLAEFEFSCIDPTATRDLLLAQVGANSSFNTVICPLNNKISTMGAAMAAFRNEEIQLCYAEPAIYNAANYSSASTTATVFDLPEV